MARISPTTQQGLRGSSSNKPGYDLHCDDPTDARSTSLIPFKTRSKLDFVHQAP